MIFTITLLMCIGAGIVGGVFYAFSTFVMKALAGVPANQGIAAMQRINVVVLNPLFLGVFIGTALLSVAGGTAFFWAGPERSTLLLVAGLVYLVGCFLVTMQFNVPRNERLARLDAGSAEAIAYWPEYLREWTRWNHVRTIASIAAAILAALALHS